MVQAYRTGTVSVGSGTGSGRFGQRVLYVSMLQVSLLLRTHTGTVYSTYLLTVTHLHLLPVPQARVPSEHAFNQCSSCLYASREDLPAFVFMAILQCMYGTYVLCIGCAAARTITLQYVGARYLFRFVVRQSAASVQSRTQQVFHVKGMKVAQRSCRCGTYVRYYTQYECM